MSFSMFIGQDIQPHWTTIIRYSEIYLSTLFLTSGLWKWSKSLYGLVRAALILIFIIPAILWHLRNQENFLHFAQNYFRTCNKFAFTFCSGMEVRFLGKVLEVKANTIKTAPCNLHLRKYITFHCQVWVHKTHIWLPYIFVACFWESIRVSHEIQLLLTIHLVPGCSTPGMLRKELHYTLKFNCRKWDT